jgi:hypothetical protein
VVVRDPSVEGRRAAERLAVELSAAGARSVVLVGSVARGDARPTSDIDLVAVGDGPRHRLLIRDGWQVSLSWRAADEIRAGFHLPADAGAAVPAWRGAVVLADHSGEAGRLKAEAYSWDWSSIDAAADAWVAYEVTGYAEEVHRLVGQTAGGRARSAGVIRCLLAVHMATILAVHHRILYETENRLWDLVAEVEGAEWTAAQDHALGVVPVSAAAAARAALDLYALVADRTAHLLDAEQTAVVHRALTVAG